MIYKWRVSKITHCSVVSWTRSNYSTKFWGRKGHVQRINFGAVILKCKRHTPWVRRGGIGFACAHAMSTNARLEFSSPQTALSRYPFAPCGNKTSVYHLNQNAYMRHYYNIMRVRYETSREIITIVDALIVRWRLRTCASILRID